MATMPARPARDYERIDAISDERMKQDQVLPKDLDTVHEPPRVKEKEIVTPPTAQQWERHRSEIIDLYSRRPLPAVRAHMRETYGFIATDRMFKGRFKTWGVDKNRRHRQDGDSGPSHAEVESNFGPMGEGTIYEVLPFSPASPISYHAYYTGEGYLRSLEHGPLHIDPPELDSKAPRNNQIGGSIPECSVPELPSKSYHDTPFEVFNQTLNCRHIPANTPTFTDSGYASCYHGQKVSVIPSITQKSYIPGCVTVADAAGEDDCRTIYSDHDGLSNDHKRRCILELSQVIKDQLGLNIGQDEWTSIKESLDELIKAFAVRLGLESRKQVNRDIMVFVHRHKKEILEQLESLILGVDEDVKSHSNNMPLEEKIRRWRSRLGTVIAADTTELFKGVKELNDEDFMDSVTLNNYNRVVTGSVSFAWLTESLKKERSLYWGSDRIHYIRQEVLANLPTGKISKSQPPNTHEVGFRIESSRLLKYRPSDKSPPIEQTLSQELLDSTVLVYSSCEAQVVSVENYLGQAWPLTWRPVHALLLSAILGPRCEVFNATLQDKTEISASHKDGVLVFRVAGSAYTVAECGEQLAWVLAALGVDPHQKEPDVHYTPTVRRILEDSANHRTPRSAISPLFNIEAQRTERDSSGGKQKLPSWVESALPKTVTIHGYPVLRRPVDCPGVEISAKFLLNAVGSFEAIVCPTHLALVGTRATVVLFMEAEGVMVWHEATSRSSSVCQCPSTSLIYDIERGPWLDMNKLQLSRHVVGSCRPGRMEELQDINPHMPATPIFERDRSLDLSFVPPRTNFGSSRATSSSPAMITSPIDEVGEYNANSVDEKISFDATTSNSTRHDYFENASHNSGSITDSSLNSDFLSMSDCSTDFEFSSLDPISPIVRNAAGKLLTQYRLINSAGNSSGSSSQRSSQLSTAVPSSTSQQSQNSTGRPQEGRKRKLQQIDDRDESDEERPASRPPKKLRLQSPKHLACPFWKFESSAHRSCFSLKLKRIRDVKQHLSRKHTPAYYCDRCSTIFKTEHQLREHVSNATGLFCNPCATLEGISRGQRLQLSRKSNKSLSEEEQWFAMWDIVFPHHKRPMSAYLESEIVEDVYLFQEYCRNHGANVLAAEIQAGSPSPLGSIGEMGTDWQSQLQSAFRLSLDSLLNDWITSRSSGISRNNGPFDSPRNPDLELSQLAIQAGSSSDSRIGSATNEPSYNLNSYTAEMPTIHENAGQSTVVDPNADQTVFHEEPVALFGFTNEDVERFLQESAVNHADVIDLDLNDFLSFQDSVCTPSCLLEPAPSESSRK